MAFVPLAGDFKPGGICDEDYPHWLAMTQSINNNKKIR